MRTVPRPSFALIWSTAFQARSLRSQTRTIRQEPIERVYTPAEHQRHHAPLRKALDASDAAKYEWKAETGNIQSYQHTETRRHLHIDGQTGRFYDQHQKQITRETAINHAGPEGNIQRTKPPANENSQSIGF